MADDTEPAARLESIRLKFAWAARQAAEIEVAIDAFVAEADYTLNLEVGHPWSSLTLHKVPPVPSDIRLLFADHVHNLRSVLDQLVWNLVDLNSDTGKPRRSVGFPVFTDASDWRDVRKKQLHGFPDQWLSVIEEAQPFTFNPPSEHPAYYIHHLDIASKHHTLVGFGLTLLHFPDPELLFNRPLGSQDRIQVVQEPNPVELEEGALLRRYCPFSPRDDLRITGVGRGYQSQVVLGPYSGDVDFPGNNAPMRNRNYLLFVGSVLEALAPAFEFGDPL